MKNRILQCFLNVDLRNGHDGLTDIAKTNGINTKNIEQGGFVVFVNTSQTKLKLFAANEVIAYLRMPQGRKINMSVIKEIPRVFNGTKINYDEGLRLAVDKALERKSKTLMAVLNEEN